jgi:hypothetical protein
MKGHKRTAAPPRLAVHRGVKTKAEAARVAAWYLVDRRCGSLCVGQANGGWHTMLAQPPQPPQPSLAAPITVCSQRPEAWLPGRALAVLRLIGGSCQHYATEHNVISDACEGSTAAEGGSGPRHRYGGVVLTGQVSVSRPGRPLLPLRHRVPWVVRIALGQRRWCTP